MLLLITTHKQLNIRLKLCSDYFWSELIKWIKQNKNILTYLKTYTANYKFNLKTKTNLWILLKSTGREVVPHTINKISLIQTWVYHFYDKMLYNMKPNILNHHFNYFTHFAATKLSYFQQSIIYLKTFPFCPKYPFSLLNIFKRHTWPISHPTHKTSVHSRTGATCARFCQLPDCQWITDTTTNRDAKPRISCSLTCLTASYCIHPV